MPVEVGAQAAVVRVTSISRSQAFVICTSLPKKPPLSSKTGCYSSTKTARKKQKWYHLPSKTPCRSQLPLPFSQCPCPRLFSLVLRLSTLRILRLLWVLSLTPTLRRSSLHRHRPSSTTFHHVLDVRSVAQILVELTDVAADVLVGLQAEGYDWEGKLLAVCNSVLFGFETLTRSRDSYLG